MPYPRWIRMSPDTHVREQNVCGLWQRLTLTPPSMPLLTLLAAFPKRSEVSCEERPPQGAALAPSAACEGRGEGRPVK